MPETLKVFGQAGINPRHIPAATAEKLTIANRGAGPRAVLTNLGLQPGEPVVTVVASLKDGKVQSTR